MKNLTIAFIFSISALLLPLSASAQTLPSPRTSLRSSADDPKNWAPGLDRHVAGIKPLLINLWDPPAIPPGFIQNAPPERDDGTGRIWNVNFPGLLVYLPPAAQAPADPPVNTRNDAADTPGRIAIIECMGGSYTHLTRLVGADDTAELFLPREIVVVSLKYRLNPPSKNVEADALADGRRAIRLVRTHAKDWHIDPHKVGLLGWSAGANLVLNLATHPDPSPDPNSQDLLDRESSRPDFIALLSPWPNGHDISAYPAPKDPPPAFVASARDDRTAPFPFAQAIDQQWQKAGAKTFFLEAQTGGHASFEISSTNEGHTWPEKFLPWLHQIGMN